MKKREIKQKAEAILAEKLCRCIKKVEKSFTRIKTHKNKSNKSNKSNKNNNSNKSNKSNKKLESSAIAICKNSIFTKKNLKTGKFKCKEHYLLKNLEKN